MEKRQQRCLLGTVHTQTHTNTQPLTQTHSLKGTDCYSARKDHKHAGKVSFVPLVSVFPSGLPVNDVPYSRKTAGVMRMISRMMLFFLSTVKFNRKKNDNHVVKLHFKLLN